MASLKIRLVTYNILNGEYEREAEIVEVIKAVVPDVVVVLEVREVSYFRRIAAALGTTACLAERRHRLSSRVGLLSRLPILHFRTLHLWPVWPACLQAAVQLASACSLAVYGLHLAAYYSWPLEWWRTYQIRTLLRHIRQAAPGQHLLAGDFDTIAPGDQALLAEAPLWVKAQT